MFNRRFYVELHFVYKFGYMFSPFNCDRIVLGKSFSSITFASFAIDNHNSNYYFCHCNNLQSPNIAFLSSRYILLQHSFSSDDFSLYMQLKCTVQPKNSLVHSKKNTNITNTNCLITVRHTFVSFVVLATLPSTYSGSQQAFVSLHSV